MPGCRENCIVAAGLIENQSKHGFCPFFSFLWSLCSIINLFIMMSLLGPHRFCRFKGIQMIACCFIKTMNQIWFMCADWRERAHPRPPPHVLFHWLQRLLQGRHQLLWQTGKRLGFTPPQKEHLSPWLQLVSSFLQGIQFYTQIKTVTSQWKAEDATVTTPAVTMPTMGR